MMRCSATPTPRATGLSLKGAGGMSASAQWRKQKLHAALRPTPEKNPDPVGGRTTKRLVMGLGLRHPYRRFLGGRRCWPDGQKSLSGPLFAPEPVISTATLSPRVRVPAWWAGVRSLRVIH